MKSEMKSVLRSLLCGAAALTMSFANLASAADAWPTKPITLIVPWAAGGSTDILARTLSEQLTKSLVALIRRMKAETVPQLLEKLHAWAEREVAKLQATKRRSAQARIDFIFDQVETVDALSDGLATVEELLTRLQELFGERRGPCIVLSTIHRAKGLEAPRVFLLAETLYCRGKRKNQEEENIAYVGITRAKETLVLVSDKKG